MPQYDDDPFAGGAKIPSLSFKDLPIGSMFVCDVLEPAKLLQSRNYDTNQPDYWDPPTNTQPKMAAVVNVIVRSGPHSVGEERSIWAGKPSSLFVAIAGAQKASGQTIAEGGVLSIAFTSEVPHENKRFNPIKQYQAKYEPPGKAVTDVFGAPTPSPTMPPARPATPPGMQSWTQHARTQAVPQGWPSPAPAGQAPLPGTATPDNDFTGF